MKKEDIGGIRQLPEMTEMMKLEQKLQSEGYRSNFRITEEGLVSDQTPQVYQPEDIIIRNFYRFEGISDPEDNSILYVIETSAGEKGLLTDAYGAYSNPDLDEFIKKVEDIQKKTNKE